MLAVRLVRQALPQARPQRISQRISQRYFAVPARRLLHFESIMAKPFADRAAKFLDFIDASPTPYHAVHSVKTRLEAASFRHIKEDEPWSSTLQPGGKYFLTRNGSTLIAFAVGEQWSPGNSFAMIGAHTDSCCLRIKPSSARKADGFLQVGVEAYGGGLWHTWFDRDLSIAGRALVKLPGGEIVSKLFKIDRPILRIPTLAIHLDRQETFSFSKETQLFPIAGLVAAELDRQGGSDAEGSASDKPDGKADDKGDDKPSNDKDGPFAALKPMRERHHPYIVEVIANAAGVEPESIVDFEALLYDTQRASLGGLNSELIFGARLDNLGMSFSAIEALIDSVATPESLKHDHNIRLVALFDHEEVGSSSAQGAASSMLLTILRRLSVAPLGREGSGRVASEASDDSYEKVNGNGVGDAFEQSLATSFLVSADMAHSVHPNYGAKYEAEHRPEMNKGTVIKINANQRYMSNSPGIVLLQEIAQHAKPEPVPLQLFVVRNDSSCGSTIGPMLASSLGTRTLDLGNAQLSMHSIRETSGAKDVEFSVRLFESFFANYGTLGKQICVD